MEESTTRCSVCRRVVVRSIVVDGMCAPCHERRQGLEVSRLRRHLGALRRKKWRQEHGTDRTCRACGRRKGLNNFYARNTNKDGYDKRCKECVQGDVMVSLRKEVESLRKEVGVDEAGKD